MKKWFINNKLYIIGAIAGAIGGLFYWKYVGCVTGTCAIASNPVKSTFYFAILGSTFLSFFKRSKKQPVEANHQQS